MRRHSELLESMRKISHQISQSSSSGQTEAEKEQQRVLAQREFLLQQLQEMDIRAVSLGLPSALVVLVVAPCPEPEAKTSAKTSARKPQSKKGKAKGKGKKGKEETTEG